MLWLLLLLWFMLWGCWYRWCWHCFNFVCISHGFEFIGVFWSFEIYTISYYIRWNIWLRWLSVKFKPRFVYQIVRRVCLCLFLFQPVIPQINKLQTNLFYFRVPPFWWDQYLYHTLLSLCYILRSTPEEEKNPQKLLDANDACRNKWPYISLEFWFPCLAPKKSGFGFCYPFILDRELISDHSWSACTCPKSIIRHKKWVAVTRNSGRILEQIKETNDKLVLTPHFVAQIWHTKLNLLA